MQSEMEAALEDVRNAYRLLYFFQKNALQVIELISDKFDGEFYYWSPYYYEITPRRGTNPLNRWTWDMLPFYYTSVLFKKLDCDSNRHIPGDWLLDLCLVSDTGYEPPQGGQEPDPADFQSVGESNTELWVTMSYSLDAWKGQWYGEYWEAVEPDNTEEVKEIESPGKIKIVQRGYDFCDFYDEESVLKQVADFKELLATNLPEKDW